MARDRHGAVGRSSYELADGTVHEYPFGLAQIEFMGTALESVGIMLDPATRTLKRLPAVPLK